MDTGDEAQVQCLVHVAELRPSPDVFQTCVGALSACMSVYHLHAWCPWRSEEGVRVPGTGVADCEPPCRCWELNSSPNLLAVSLVLIF